MAAADDLYAVRQDPDTNWTVFNKVTGEVAEIGDLKLVRLTKADAEDFTTLLNWLRSRRLICGNL
ncbi:hypothetical protein HGP17_32655 [Rhizobium sp. P38BS-XIX]|uniref:hypothetical protein n=1 Tax=Rhizobium sp. P38BS-XIX TaxID=2726740 RepID=UPI0014572117|nr:hypothetical protein [Rhizobium sp. P38BS-XIX]NLS01611.1 hypothetical protein [Rhizobium sp. P38BS-XIX]